MNHSAAIAIIEINLCPLLYHPFTIVELQYSLNGQVSFNMLYDALDPTKQWTLWKLLHCNV